MNWVKSLFSKGIGKSTKDNYFSIVMLMGIEFEPSPEDVDYIVFQEGLDQSDRVMAIKGHAEWIKNENDIKNVFNQMVAKIEPGFTVKEISVRTQNINGRPFFLISAKGY